MSLDKQLYNFARRGVMPLMQNGIGGGPIGMDSQGKMIRMGVGRDFFVAGNWGSDNNDGSSWDKAFLTLAAAITANNADVAADKYGWATRNRIWFTADYTTETLVAFPAKCDVIGVGSYDANDKAGLYGHHAPVNASNYGTRWFNTLFRAKAHASAIITLTNASSGMQFLDGCCFDATLGTVTYAISATASPFMRVQNVEMRGGFASGYIYIGAGECGGLRILDNILTGSLSKGVVLDSGATASWEALMKGNFVQCADLWVDDDANILYIVDNDGLTAIDCATYTAGFDANLLRMSGNRQTGSNAGDHDNVPHELNA